MRWILFVYATLVICPIRYWPQDLSLDNSWVFALNYGAAHGLAIGRDLVWTTGPLSHLVFPQDIGNNLANGLIFQGIVWGILIAVFFDVFFRSGFALRNLAAFSAFFGLSAPLYWSNYMGLENLLLAGVLMLLIMFRWRGGTFRYVLALGLTGVIPLIKLTGGILAAGAVIGFLADKAIRSGWKARREIVLAATIPAAVAGIGCWVLLPSFQAFVQYVRTSLELAGNYSIAMSIRGDPVELAGAAETMVWIGVLLYVAAKNNRSAGCFFLALLPLPILVSLKHGFVRQDFHVINFFCFANLALALIALVMSLEGKRIAAALLILLPNGIIFLEYIGTRLGIDAIEQAAGIEAMPFAYHALRFGNLRQSLAAQSLERWPADIRVEPEIRAIVQQSPVASMSIAYSSALMDGLNLQLYPVVQRYAAYTPHLDGLNAAWIRDKGPRFLIFAWERIDDRNPWAETPATWLEVYRWYNTRLLANRNVLLERRTEPRFLELKLIRHFETAFAGAIDLPDSKHPLFWTLTCDPSAAGTLRKLFWRVPEVTMTVDEHASFRVIPEVLAAPVLGNLPNTLADLAATFDAGPAIQPSVRKIAFSGPGIDSYRHSCRVELFATPD